MTLNSIINKNNDKYLINVKLNDQLSQGYVDLGSQCTLIKYCEAKRLGIKWTMGPLPTMRGIGNNVILPLGKAIVKIEIQNIIETIEAYIVEDSVMKYATLVGHSFTEKPGINITKTNDALIFSRAISSKLRLIIIYSQMT